MPNSSVTLQDIANELGLSVSTVSRALCEETANKVKPATKEKIEQAIKKLGYVQTKAYTSAATADEISIGIIIATPGKAFHHEFFAEMLNPLLSEIYKIDCHVGYVLSENFVPKEKFLQIIQNTKVSGAIVMGRLDEDFLSFLKNSIPHIVYTGVNYVGHDTDEVVCNAFEAIETLYDHFKEIGYNTIGYIGSTNMQTTKKNDYHRYTSFLNCQKKYGDIFDKEHISSSGNETMQSGYDAMMKIIRTNNLPKAIICASDSCAVGALRAAHENGIAIPKDIAIAGVDNLMLSDFTSPKLTTVDVPKSELVRLAINMLIDRIKNNREKNIRLDIPSELIIRESCGYHLANPI